MSLKQHKFVCLLRKVKKVQNLANVLILDHHVVYPDITGGIEIAKIKEDIYQLWSEELELFKKSRIENCPQNRTIVLISDLDHSYNLPIDGVARRKTNGKHG